MTQRGSCMCGEVRFTVEGKLRQGVACHCVQCRKGSGHYVVATSAPRKAISVEGVVTWFEYKPGVRRGFCGTCGSQLFWEERGSERMSIMMGVLDGDTGLGIEGHIFVGEKGDYYEVPQDLPSATWDDPFLTTRQ